MRSRSLRAPPCCNAAAAIGIIASASAVSPCAVTTCAAGLGAASSAAVSTSIKSSSVALGAALGRSAAGSASALEAALVPVPVASTPSKAACALENRCMMAACRSLASCLRRSTSF